MVKLKRWLKNAKWTEILSVAYIFLLAFNPWSSFDGTLVLLLSAVFVVFFAFSFLNKITKDERKSFLLFSIPIFVLCFFLSFSQFWFNAGGGSFNFFVNGLTSFLTFLCLYVLGFSFARMDNLNLKHLLLGLIVGFALATFISLIGNLASYPFMYAETMKGQVYYYDGIAYRYGTDTLWFSSWGLQTVSLEYGSFIPFLLTLFPALFFFTAFNKKEVFTWINIAGAAIGLLYLLLIPNVIALLLIVAIYLLLVILYFAIFKKTKLTKKIYKYRKVDWIWLGSILGVIAILVLFVFIIAFLGKNIYEANPVLRKIFDNGRLMHPINQMINAVMGKNGSLSLEGVVLGFFLGLNPFTSNGYVTNTFFGGAEDAEAWTNINLHTFEVHAFSEGGILAFLAILTMFVFFYLMVRKYFSVDQKNRYILIFACIFLTGVLIYQSLQADAFPYVYKPSSYSSPFRNNIGFMLGLLLIGLSYQPLFCKEEMIDEE